MRGVLLLMVLLPTLASAQIYRWVDSQGQVHFGERPPSGAEQIDVRPQVMERDAATRDREARTARLFEASREERQAALEQARQRHAERDRECQGLRHQLSRLAPGRRYFRTDAQGERIYYSEAELVAARQSLSSRLSQKCS